jgi:hypothetical protein
MKRVKPGTLVSAHVAMMGHVRARPNTDQGTSVPYLGSKVNFCPPTLASYINPPFAMVKMATPCS